MQDNDLCGIKAAPVASKEGLSKPYVKSKGRFECQLCSLLGVPLFPHLSGGDNVRHTADGASNEAVDSPQHEESEVTHRE